MRHLRAIWCALFSFSLAVALTAMATGCGGSGKTTPAGSGSTTTPATDAVTGVSQERYAHTELASISLRQLQECPSDGSTTWVVQYHGKQARASCGTGSAAVRAGNTTITLKNGWCAMNSAGDVNYYFGTIVDDPSVSGLDQPGLAYGPLRFDITLGIAPHQPVNSDGTYTDTPVGDVTKTKYGINAVIAGNGNLWTNDQFDHTTTVTLTHQRTRGSFTATAVTGGSISGTFRCGSRVVGDAAPPG
jgi:hypothetical protein